MGAFPYLPFCSVRCKTIDLGRWLGGRYRVTTPAGEPSAEDSSDDEEFPQAGRSSGRST